MTINQDPDLIQLAYEQSAATAEECKRCLLGAFAVLGLPDNIIDIGCGQGHLVEMAAHRLSTHAYGVDCIARSEDLPTVSLDGFDCRILQCDLSLPGSAEYILHNLNAGHISWHPTDTTFVLCWEVAEHLPPSAAPLLCDTLSSLTRSEDTLLFCAATPGQGGAGHINERPHSFWIDMFTARGLTYQDNTTIALRTVMSVVAPSAWWYGRNMLAFTGSVP